MIRYFVLESVPFYMSEDMFLGSGRLAYFDTATVTAL